MAISVDVAIFDEIAVTFAAIVAGMVLDTVNSLKLEEKNQTLDQILLCATSTNKFHILIFFLLNENLTRKPIDFLVLFSNVK